MSKQKKRISIGREQAWDSTFQLMSWWKTEDVTKAKVMVVGAGALGNEVLKNLALLNIGHILIIDFDTIEYSNLSRSILFRKADAEKGAYKADVAASRIQEINPNIKVKTIKGDITIDVGLGVFREMDVVIGCLDNRLARLFLNRACHKVDKVWIDGAIENLAGELTVYKPNVSCYECELTDREWEHIRFRMGCPDIAARNAAYGRIPTTPISSSIIAAMQVQEALKVIHKNEKQSMAGQKFYYEGMNSTMLQYPVNSPKQDCMSHFLYEPIIEIAELSAEMTIAQALEMIGSHLGEEQPVIVLDHELILELTTEKSEQAHAVVMPKPHLSESYLSQFVQEMGESVLITKEAVYIGRDFPNQDLSLKAIGIPHLHIIQVEAKGETHFIELSGDKDWLQFS